MTTDSHSVHFSASERARILECIQALRISYANFFHDAVMSCVEQCEGFNRGRVTDRLYKLQTERLGPT